MFAIASANELAAPRRVGFAALRHSISRDEFFAGLKIPEVADALGVSAATVEREWAMAKAWLHQRLSA